MINFITEFSPWLWVIVLVLCSVIEAFTFGLTTIWAAIAAIPMIFIAKTSISLKWQILIFVIITVILIISTRPFAVKKLNNGKQKTNVDSVIGQEVLIIKPVSKFEKGQAKAKNGVIWNVKATSENDIPKDSVCKITEIEGNTISVELIK